MTPQKAEMLRVANVVGKAVESRDPVLELDWACVGGLVGILTLIRIHGLSEQRIMTEAMKAVRGVRS